MNRIHWTQEEHEIVLQEAIRMYQTGAYTLQDAIKSAQRIVLPAHRQRTFSGTGSTAPLTKELRRRCNEILPSKVTPTAAVSVVSEPRPEAQTLTIDPLQDAIHAIAMHLAERIANEVRGQLKQVQELDHYFTLPKHDGSYEGNRLFKPRVTIIGLLNDQVHSIQREFGDKFSVRCIDTDRAMGLTPPDADAYLLMKNFINHPLYHKYRDFPNHVLIDGGMSSLRMWFHTKGKEL